MPRLPSVALSLAVSLGILWICAIGARPAIAKVVLVGVDGGSWNVIDPMLASGELPDLAALADRGVTAELQSVEPVISPTVWTSIATGRSPEQHGVTDFYSTATRLRVPTVFERLAAHGVRTGLYDCLMTWPPQTFPDGFVIPAWLRRDESVTPPDVWSRISLAPFVTHFRDLYTTRDYLELSRVEVRSKAERWNQLSEAFDLQAGAVTFYAIDMVSHRFWLDAFPEQFETGGKPDPAFASAVADTVRGVDRAIGEIDAALGPDDVLLIASDHGFRAREGGPKSVWVPLFDDVVAEAGLEPERDGFLVVGQFGGVSVRIQPGPFDAREAVYDELVALLESYRARDGEPLLETYRIDIAERPPGARRPLGERVRQWVVREVLTRWFDVNLDPKAHAVIFARPLEDRLESLWPDGSVVVNGRTMPLSQGISRQRFTGDHHPTGIFLAAGGPIQRQEERQRISVLDIAPLILYVSGAPIPDDLEGELPEGWFSREFTAAHPPSTIPADRLPGLERGRLAAGSEAGSELTEKLRSLGYVD